MAVDNLKVPKEDVQVLFNNPEAVRRMFEEGIQKLVDDEFAKHSGFSVHCGKPINADDVNGRKTLSEYISRAPFSLERMSF